MELISRDALIEKYGDWYIEEGTEEGYIGSLETLLSDEPTIDPEPVAKWISVKDRLPEEHESIFHKFLGTPKWSSAMWQQESDKVLVCVYFPDGTRVVTTGCLHNSDWMTTVSKTLPQIVTHWMPLPEPPMEGDNAD